MQLHRRKHISFLSASGFMIALVLATVCTFVKGTSQVHAAAATITPAGAFTDNNGNYIQAHGGGITRVGSTYYWFGEDKNGETSSNTSFQDIPCYSSTDLAHWTFVSYVLTRQVSGDLGPNRIVECPNVIYNDTTQQYVMYMHTPIPSTPRRPLSCQFPVVGEPPSCTWATVGQPPIWEPHPTSGCHCRSTGPMSQCHGTTTGLSTPRLVPGRIIVQLTTIS